MSDEEDTANLLKTETVSIENEYINTDSINSQSNTDTKSLCMIQSTVGLLAIFTSGLYFGYDFSIVSNIMPTLIFSWHFNCAEQFSLALSWMIGAMVASLFCGALIDKVWGRYSVFISSLLMLLQFYTAAVQVKYEVILGWFFNRFLSGLCSTLVIKSVLVFICEESHPHIRGFRVTLLYVGISMGIIITYLVGLNIPLQGYPWRIAMLFSFILLAISCFLIKFTKPALTVLQQLRQFSRGDFPFKKSLMRETLFISVSLIILKLLLGKVSILFYTPQLLTMLGICATQTTSIAIISFIIVKFLSTCASLHIVDQTSRRATLIISSLIMMISAAFLAILASLEETESSFAFLSKETCQRVFLSNIDGLVIVQKESVWNTIGINKTRLFTEKYPPYPPLPTPLSLLNSDVNSCMNPNVTSSLLLQFSRIISIILLFVYEAAYTFSFGTLTWIIICEIIPIGIKGRWICILNSIHLFANLLIPSYIFQDGFHFAPEFLTQSFIGMLSAIIVFLIVPETQMKTLIQINQELHNTSLLTRICQNLCVFSYFNKSPWIHQKSKQYRHQSKSAEKTII